MNAKATTHEYIEDSGPTDVIESYQPSTNMPLTAYIGDPVYEYVFGLYKNQETDARTKAMRVFQNKTSDGKYEAQETDCTVTIENFNFVTGIITFAIKQSGTPKLGAAEVAESTDSDGNKKYTPTFTPAA